MNRRRWGDLIFGIAVFSIVPLLAAGTSAPLDGPWDEPWPVLLAGEPDGQDPEFAALQRRANDVLEKLVQPARS